MVNDDGTAKTGIAGLDGIVLGQPLIDFQGVLRGVPAYLGERGPLLEESES